MKVKINEKWFEGRYNDERKFIIPLSEEQDIKFFYKWQKKSNLGFNGQYLNGTAIPKSDYVKDVEYKTICESGTLINCYPILNLNEDEVWLKFDNYKTIEGYNKEQQELLDEVYENYESPANVFVAGFLGSPTMNFFKGTIIMEQEHMIFIEEHGPQIRAHLGVVPQQDNLDTELTVTENLFIYGRYFGLSKKFIRTKIEELLEFAQLEEKRDVKVDALSGGMKRRLTIARALVSEPDILMLDEPTTGLDPQARHILWDRLFRLKELGVTLVITTHFMDEAEQLCDRLVVMDKGKIMAEGSPLELIKAYSTKEVLPPLLLVYLLLGL